ncbi:hypothetical protein BaRGS_00033105 [Batillaria attramentaria]|uniref:Uncharacterized protein n=1 Tax=Batillaria attramentaria TaxID=370345 RepID=A0ABD0JLE9_9CAEN
MDAGTREQGHKKELYELVGLRGGGKLLQLAEERNESLLDHEIKQITRQRAFQNPDPSPTCSPRCCKRFWCRCFVDGDCDTNQIHVQSQTEGFMYGSGSGKQVSLVTLAHMQDKFGGEMPIRKDKAAWRPDGKTSGKYNYVVKQ